MTLLQNLKFVSLMNLTAIQGKQAILVPDKEIALKINGNAFFVLPERQEYECADSRKAICFGSSTKMCATCVELSKEDNHLHEIFLVFYVFTFVQPQLSKLHAQLSYSFFRFKVINWPKRDICIHCHCI